MRSRSFLGFDITMLISVLSLMVIGVLFIYSSGVTSTGMLFSKEYIKQIISGVTGIIVMLIFAFGNYDRMKDYSLYVYILFIILLVFTLFFGKLVNGARSWLTIGNLHVGQPSEFMKIVTILFIGKYLDDNRQSVHKFQVFMTAFFIIFLPVLLILLQPDMGTALVYFPIFLFMIFMAGGSLVQIMYFILLGLFVVIMTMLPFGLEYLFEGKVQSLGFLFNVNIMLLVVLFFFILSVLSLAGYLVYKRKYFFWLFYIFSIICLSVFASIFIRKFLKSYQIMRLIVFLNPDIDRQGTGWNIIQSMTAVGSGGFFGKGFLQGTQSHYRFLPQQSTDFIFSIISEEWGFLGSFFVILFFGLIMVRSIFIMRSARNLYGSLIASGILGMIFFHFIINIGMTIGKMPITGIPLLFLSYGGSSLWTALTAIGLLINVHQRRYRY